MTRSQPNRYLFMLVLGAMLLLTGCMKVQMDMTIHDDGTADINLITALSRDVMELDPDAPELSDDELVAGMLEDGEGCEADESLSALRASDPVPYITDEWVGVSCTVDNVPLDEISEGDGLITQADGITSIALPLDDVNDQIESEVDANAAMGDMEGMEALFEQIMSTFEIAMAVEAPGAVIEHNGTRVEGSTVIWEIDVFADEPGRGTGDFDSALARHPHVVATHHVGASTAQAQAAVTDGTIETVLAYRSGTPVNVVNLDPAPVRAATVTVRHHDRVGVLASVLAILRKEKLNISNMQNRVFAGSKAAVASIDVGRLPTDALIGEVQSLDDVIYVSVTDV